MCTLKVLFQQSIISNMDTRITTNRALTFASLFVALIFILVFTLVFTLVFDQTTSLASELPDEITQCTKQRGAMQRLTCYDTLATKHKLVAEQDFINPNPAFLESKLAVTPWTSEYSLSVQGFVDLISSAVMDDGEKVAVHGWTKEGHQYVLSITMRTLMYLKFLPLETATDEIPMSLLKQLNINGDITDAELFVTTIASMVPDDKK